MTKMDRVLITGITGMVGSHMADMILGLRPKLEIFGLHDRRFPMDNIRHIEDKVNLIEGDLTDLSSMLRVIEESRPDYISHLAAQSYVPYSYLVPSETLSSNVIGTSNLMEAIRLCHLTPKIHICSSIANVFFKRFFHNIFIIF